MPRLLDGLNWPVLNELIERCFGVRIPCHETPKWIAIDGKALRGTLAAGDKQNLILAVVHDTREVVAQARQCGDKSSEIPVVRELLKDSGLEKQKVSLDAHHFNPITTAQIDQAGGVYLTQVKENQATFLQQCKTLRTQFLPLAETIDHEKASARQDFSRKLKWDPSDFSGEKLSWRLLPSAARVRPASAAAHNSPSVRCTPLAYANDLTPCRMVAF